MAVEPDRAQDEEESPYAGHRGLLATVIGMGVLIVIALAVVVYGIVTRMSAGAEAPAPAAAVVPAGEGPYRRTLDMPEGAEAVSGQAAGGVVIVAVDRGGEGKTFIIVDAATGREVGRIAAPLTPAVPQVR